MHFLERYQLIKRKVLKEVWDAISIEMNIKTFLQVMQSAIVLLKRLEYFKWHARKFPMNFYEQNKQVQRSVSWTCKKSMFTRVYTKSVFIVLEVKCERVFIDLEHLARRIKYKLQFTVRIESTRLSCSEHSVDCQHKY